MYMLDTDICSYILREHPITVLEKFKKVETEKLCVSIITQAELFCGAERSVAKRINSVLIEDFLRRLIILDWDKYVAQEYAKMRVLLEAKGTIIGNMNLMIAAHALSTDATIVTNNIRHFNRIPNLKIENWVKS